MNSSKVDNIILFLMVITIIISVINVIFYIFDYSNIKFLITSLVSLFLVGVSIVTLVLKNSSEDNLYDKYILLTKEEYKNLKQTIYTQEQELKKLRSTIDL